MQISRININDQQLAGFRQLNLIQNVYLAKEDLNFSCASRATRASSSSYRLQLYHELPCGSQLPRHTQQNSCLQF